MRTTLTSCALAVSYSFLQYVKKLNSARLFAPGENETGQTRGIEFSFNILIFQSGANAEYSSPIGGGNANGL